MFGISISTHTPLARRDARNSESRLPSQHFYSHASCEARPSNVPTLSDSEQFLLTRLLRGATPAAPAPADGHLISTHTPLAGRAESGSGTRRGAADFYSHASCEARLRPGCNLGDVFRISTHTPLARRDAATGSGASASSDFYSHASCEARR